MNKKLSIKNVQLQAIVPSPTDAVCFRFWITIRQLIKAEINEDEFRAFIKELDYDSDYDSETKQFGKGWAKKLVNMTLEIVDE